MATAWGRGNVQGAWPKTGGVVRWGRGQGKRAWSLKDALPGGGGGVAKDWGRGQSGEGRGQMKVVQVGVARGGGVFSEEGGVARRMGRGQNVHCRAHG